VHQVHSFLSLAGYYRRFILNFSKISKPITDLLKKEEKFVWNAECDEAFQTLKKLLTTSPVLAQPDIAKSFDGADHMRHVGLLQPLSIPAWKWKDISMNFVVGLPLTNRKFNSILVIVDRLTKSAHFIPMHTFDMTELYVSRILCLHGVPNTIISN
jgi:hypothetical protein